MDAEALWAIVEAVQPRVDEDPRGFDDALAHHLAALGEATIIAFSDAWVGLSTEAYTWDLWAAAWVLRGHCFEVAFTGFRDRLVALGDRVFERAVHDPATL